MKFGTRTSVTFSKMEIKNISFIALNAIRDFMRQNHIRMKHFSNDGCNPQPDYDKGILSHEESEDNYERSTVFHYEPDPEDWYENTIHHFND